LAALLTADAGDTEAIARLVAEATRMKIPVLPPDVNESGTDFTVVHYAPDPMMDFVNPSSDDGFTKSIMPNAVRFGLNSIKNFGDGIAKAILDERSAHGPYTGLADFLSRVGSKNLNRKSLESLIKGGALDSLGERGELLANIETLLAYHRDMTTEAPQDSLFGSLAAPTLGLLPAEPVSLLEKLAWEKELLGMYVSGHPLDAHASLLAKAPMNLGKIKAEPQAGVTVILPVLVAEVRTILTKSGEKMAFVKFEDKTDSLEAVVFPKLYKEHGLAVAAGACMVVKAKVSKRGGELSLAVENLRAL
jgi:DNA polymerase-3 subunit alpha